MIVAGGLGTRLRSVVQDRPKVLALVGGRPFLEFLFDRLINFGISKVVLCTGYMAEKVEELYGTSYQSLSISYSREETPKGTGGAIRDATHLISSRSVLVLNGDSIADVDLGQFIAGHSNHLRKISLVVFKVPDVSRYGNILFESASGKVLAFKEKKMSTGEGWINAGVYLIERESLQELPPQTPLSLESDVFPRWIEDEEVFCYPLSHGTFVDIGTPDSYAEANALVNKGKL